MGGPDPSRAHVLRFGVFEVDLRAGELRKQGVRTRLQEQPLQVLLLLLARPGDVVTREELREKLWPADTFVDFEHSLNAAVKRLRDALGDSAENPRFIETLPRRGYRFLLPVEDPGRAPSLAPAAPLSEREGLLVPRWVVAVALALLVAAVGLTRWLSRRAAGTAGPMLTRLTSDSGLTTDPAVSPDGRLLAYASDRGGDGNLDIWVQQLSSGQPLRLTDDPADDHEPAFSSDGTRIAFRSEREGGGIYVVSALGGDERVIVHEGRRPRFSPDGTQIAYWTGGGGTTASGDLTAPGTSKIYVVASTGGPPRQLRPEFASARHPVWSPDGKQILFLGVRDPEIPREGRIAWWLSSLEGGEPIKTGILDAIRGHGLTGVTAPDQWVDDRVLFSDQLGDSTNVWQIPVSAARGQVAGPPERLTFGTLEVQPALAGGRVVFHSGTENVDIWSLPIAADEGRVTGELERLTQTTAADINPYLSADGKTLAFVSFKPGSADVWVMDLATAKQTNLTATPLAEGWPVVSADGSRVAYTVPVSSAANPFHVVPARGGVPEKVCDACGRLRDWSPDGTKMLYQSGEPRGVSVLDLASGRKTEILRDREHNLYQCYFSRDGRWITFLAQIGPERRRLHIVPFRGETAVPERDWIEVTDGRFSDDKPRFSPDGNLLYFTSDRDGFLCLWGQRLEATTKRPSGAAFPFRHFHSARFSMMNVPLHFLDVSVGRDRLILNLAERTGNIWMAEPQDGR